MRMRTYLLPLLFAAGLLAAGCDTAPKTPEARDALTDDARATLKLMQDKDAGLNNVLSSAYGYAIFPSVGKGGLIVGGAYGKGEVYEHGLLIGYSDLTQGSVGLQAGGKEYAELILFETADALNRFRSGDFAFGANASAVALKAGASGAARFEDGILVFTMPKGGLMFEVSLSGQKFKYLPLSGVEPTTRPIR